MGDIGLVEMPSARMAPDGNLSISVSALKNVQRYNFNFQALPWLAVTFRYSGLQHFDPQFPSYYDRSYGFGIRLLKESEYLPDVTLGLRDVIGTGVYSGEYVSATKRIFDDFDATIGVGWGRLASTDTFRNPFTYLSASFNKRDAVSGIAGSFSYKEFFHGPHLGLFGGFDWHTPIDGLAIAAEYSSDAYTEERQRGTLHPRAQVNVRADYHLSDSVQVGVAYLYGTTPSLTLAFDLDPTAPSYSHSLGPDLPAPEIRSPEQQFAALQALIPTSSMQSPVSRATLPGLHRLASQFAAISHFADGLIKDQPEIQDIAFQGKTLILGTAKRGSSCLQYAQLAAAYLSDVDTIVIKAPKAGQTSCSAQPGAPGIPLKPAFLQTAAEYPDSPSFAAPVPRPPANTVADNAALEAEVRQAVTAQGLQVEAVDASASDIAVYYRNERYGTEAQAIGRIVRVLMKVAPPGVEYFRLVTIVGGMPVERYKIERSAAERAMDAGNDPAALAAGMMADRPPLHDPILSAANRESYPRFSWDFGPDVRTSFFDPAQPIRLALVGVVNAAVDLTPKVSLSTSLEGNIWNNFSGGKASDSTLPHVRSDTTEYYNHGASGIEELVANYRFRLTPSVFVSLKGGYLESMFGGAGGEILWSPNDSRIAVGADLYEVWQRKFDRLFGFQKYHVLTGHVAFYYASPWYGLNLRVMSGRYLAGDHGLTFQLSRRFSTGVELGLFATITNVSAAQFGEGSFDKGFIIRIPLDWTLPIPTQRQIAIDLRPVTRDGGQRLAGDATLYDWIRRPGYGELTQHWPEIVDP